MCLYTDKALAPLCENVSRKHVSISVCLRVSLSGLCRPRQAMHELPRSPMVTSGSAMGIMEDWITNSQDAGTLWKTLPQEVGPPAPHLLTLRTRRGCYSGMGMCLQSQLSTFYCKERLREKLLLEVAAAKCQVGL